MHDGASQLGLSTLRSIRSCISKVILQCATNLSTMSSYLSSNGKNPSSSKAGKVLTLHCCLCSSVKVSMPHSSITGLGCVARLKANNESRSLISCLFLALVFCCNTDGYEHGYIAHRKKIQSSEENQINNFSRF